VLAVREVHVQSVDRFYFWLAAYIAVSVGSYVALFMMLTHS
jgi:hypothetical protein